MHGVGAGVLKLRNSLGTKHFYSRSRLSLRLFTLLHAGRKPGGRLENLPHEASGAAWEVGFHFLEEGPGGTEDRADVLASGDAEQAGVLVVLLLLDLADLLQAADEEAGRDAGKALEALLGGGELVDQDGFGGAGGRAGRGGVGARPASSGSAAAVEKCSRLRVLRLSGLKRQCSESEERLFGVY
jgi:hypothetical protein